MNQNSLHKLIGNSKLSGPTMTNAFKIIGNGDMQTGVKFFAEYFHDTGITFGKKCGMRNGIVMGSIGASVITSAMFIGIIIKNKYELFQQEKLLRKQEEYIIKSLNNRTCKFSNNEEIITSKS